MRQSYFKVFDQPSDAMRSRCEKLGYAAMLMGSSPTTADLTPTYLREVVDAAILCRNIKFYFNVDGVPVGYVIWAWLSDEVAQRIVTEDALNLHISEWNEGPALWILDCVAKAGTLRHIARDLRTRLFPDSASLSYIARHGKLRMPVTLQRTGAWVRKSAKQPTVSNATSAFEM